MKSISDQVVRRASRWVVHVDGKYVGEFYTPYVDVDVTVAFRPDDSIGGEVTVGNETMTLDVGDVKLEIVSVPL